MLMMTLSYDVESGDRLERAGDALDTLPEGHKFISTLVHVQSDVPSDDDNNNFEPFQPFLFDCR